LRPESKRKSHRRADTNRSGDHPEGRHDPYDPPVVPSLPELFAVFIPIGSLIGGTFGLAARAPTPRDLVRNVLDGAGVGALGGTALGLVIWLGGSVAGG
jgi:hypothetical protein